MLETPLNHNQVYTLVGWFNYDKNRFTTIDGNIIECYSYRHLAKDIKNYLTVVNIKYVTDNVNAWVIFQAVILEEEEEVTVSHDDTMD